MARSSGHAQGEPAPRPDPGASGPACHPPHQQGPAPHYTGAAGSKLLLLQVLPGTWVTSRGHRQRGKVKGCLTARVRREKPRQVSALTRTNGMHSPPLGHKGAEIKICVVLAWRDSRTVLTKISPACGGCLHLRLKSESHSAVPDSVTPWTIQSAEFSRPEYRSG